MRELFASSRIFFAPIVVEFCFLTSMIMKKFLPLILVALTSITTTSAQGVRYGITGAMNLSRYAIELGGVDYTPDSRVGFNAGFRVEMEAPFISDGFYFDAELLLSSKGAEVKNEVEGVMMKSIVRPYYLELPIHIGYRYMFSGDKVGLFGSFGPYFGVGLFGTSKVTVGDESSKPDVFSSDGLKRFDFGLGVRGGVQLFDHYRIFVGYDWGLINISQGDDKINNRNLYIGASYMF